MRVIVRNGEKILKQTNPNDNPWRAFALVSIIGVDIVVSMLGGYWLGSYISDVMGGQTMWTAAGIFAGFIVGVVSIIFIIRSYLEGPNG